MASYDGNVTIRIYGDAEPAKHAIADLANASKKYFSTISDVMKTPTTNLEKVLHKTISTTNNYIKEYKKLKELEDDRATQQKEIETSINNITSALAKQQKIQSRAKGANTRTSNSYKKAVNEQIAATKKLNEAKQELSSIGGKNTDQYVYKRLQEEIERIKSLDKSERTSTDKALIGSKYPEQFKMMKDRVKNTKEEMELYNKKIEEAKNKVKELQKELDEAKEKTAKLKESSGNASKRYKESQKEVKRLEKELDTAISKQEEFNKSGKKYEENIKAIKGRMTQLTRELDNLSNQNKSAIFSDMMKSPIKSLLNYNTLLKDLENGNDKASQRMLMIGTAARQVASDFKKCVSRLRQFANLLGKITGLNLVMRRLRNEITGVNKINWSKAIRQIVQYGFGFRSLFFLVRRVRTMFVQAMENMATKADEVKEGILSIKSSGYMLRNSMATALAPLINIVAKAMAQLAQWAVTAANAIAQFIAVLTNQDYFYSASASAEDYATSLDDVGSSAKEAKKQLAGFDEIDVLDKDTGSSGSSSGSTPIGAWTKNDNPMSDLAQMIKDAWDSNGSFEEIGKYLGEGLKKALDTALTKFWSPVQAKAKKLGKAIAETINGVLKTDGLAKSLAQNIAAAINTAYGYLSSYWGTLDFGAIADFINESINTLLDSINWDDIRTSITSKIKGVIDLLYQTIVKGGWLDKALQNLSTQLEEGLNELIKVDPETGKNSFEKLGESISTALTSIFNSISTFLTENKDTIVQGIGDFIRELDTPELRQAIVDLVSAIAETFWDTLVELFTESETLKIGTVAFAGFELGKIGYGALKIKLFTETLKTALSGAGLAAGEGAATSVADGLAAGLTAEGNVVTVGEAVKNLIVNAFTSIGGFLGAAFAAAPFIEQLKIIFGLASEEEKEGFEKLYFGAKEDTIVYTKTILSDTEDIWQDQFGNLYERTFNWVTAKYDNFTQITGEQLATYKAMIEAQSQGVSDAVKSQADSTTENLEKNKQSIIDYDNTILESSAGTKLGLEEATASTKVETDKQVAQYQKASLDEKKTLETFKKDSNTLTKNTLSENVKTNNSGLNTLVDNTGSAMNTMASNIASIANNSILPAWTSMYNQMIEVARKAHEQIQNESFNKVGFNSVSATMSTYSLPALKQLTTSGKVPAMASGGVIPPNKPFLAMLGDQKRGMNIETPLDTMVQAFEQAISNMGMGGYSEQEIVMNIDGNEFARLTVPNNLKELGRRGYNVKVLNKK